jgi:hypothetical protein
MVVEDDGYGWYLRMMIENPQFYFQRYLYLNETLLKIAEK